MDHVARGIATAALTMQSIMAQALVANGVMTPSQVLEMIDLALDASRGRATTPVEKKIELVALQCLEDMREALAALVNLRPCQTVDFGFPPTTRGLFHGETVRET